MYLNKTKTKLVTVLTKNYSNCFVIMLHELPKALIKVVALFAIKCQREELFSWATIVLSLLNMENHHYYFI